MNLISKTDAGNPRFSMNVKSIKTKGENCMNLVQLIEF